MATILMNPPAPSAFAAYYSLSAPERVAAAVRLIRILKRSRKQMLRRTLHSQRLDIKFGCHGGYTQDYECHALTLTRWVMWLERRYGLEPKRTPRSLLEHLRREERESIRRPERQTVERRPGRF
ncbi:unnamed protein product [Gemmata massiliana]|uniref:Uncharacterized protein n=1 Tax=Gemmata massiliana TaxID=1210884 RepID=A0A6P2DGT4_9BACT|nr:hypothetical protein [Gemmata massiliana]VTS00824.1 unnamed protein product [Gemmata massiliana]